jgi:predicted type IV restriction endonuclease
MAISKRSAERAMSGLKRLVSVIQQQKARDVSEADTVTLVKDVMSEVFGFDKYSELTSEHAIRGTYCDLVVEVDKKTVELVEVKSAGTTLDDRHVKQAIDYAANKGVEWVVLTNGSIWRLYQVLFAKPIDKRLLREIDLTTLDLRSDGCIDCLSPFMKEGFAKSVQEELRDRQDATSRYLLSALILNNDNVAATIRRELRRVVDVLVGDDEILKVLRGEVIKRETLEGPEAETAARRVNKIASRNSRAKAVAPPTLDKALKSEPSDDAANAKLSCDPSPGMKGQSAI